MSEGAPGGVTLPLRCRCGALRGSFDVVEAPGSRSGNPRWPRVVCYCDDCQAWARFLAVTGVMNERGGTEVIQTWPARIRLDSGAETLALARLSPKGLHRWFASCCRSPVGNTMGSAGMPFVGLMRGFVDASDAELDAVSFPAAGVQGRFAISGCPPDAVPSATLPVMWRAASALARGWWAGANAPSPFFTAAGEPTRVARVLKA